jgi:hypothetical protein
VKSAPTWREVGVLSFVFAGAVAMLAVAHRHYPVQTWLVWRYVVYWSIGLGWLSACASAGSRLVRVLAARLPAYDAAVMSLACGILLFFWAMFAAGLVGQMTPAFAVLLPFAMLACGGARPWRALRRLALPSLARVRPTFVGSAAAGMGTLALGMIYLTVSTPENLGFDAQWYHLPIAEHFAAGQHIGRFPEGWYLGAYPHLASVLYAWAFLLPCSSIFDRVMLAAHLEWFLFLVTVFSVPLLVRRLVPRAPNGTWALTFLFPSVFLYDGGLFVGADHVLAFWVIPAYLALLRVERRLAPGNVLLLAVVLSGAVLTKYQAMYVLLPVGARLVWVPARGRAPASLFTRLAHGPALAVAAGLVLTSAHWLANLLWYGDPFFPALHRHLTLRPWSAEASRQLEVFYQAALWQPQGTWVDKALATARALVTFSFEPHDWPTYHGAVPVFGSLFTVLSFAVVFLRGARRALHLIVSTSSGVALWFLTSHQDRYLQCLLPWMVAASAAVLVLAARQLPRARPALWLLIAVQWAWGLDVYFIPAKDNSYENDRPSPIKAAVDLASSGYGGDYAQRLELYPPWGEIGRALPAGAQVLVHERYLHLGLGRKATTDLPGWQSGISYGSWHTPRAIHEQLRALGVTHLVWETGRSHGSDTLTGDLAFFRFLQGARSRPRTFRAFSLLALDDVDDRPADAPRVAFYRCPLGEGRVREAIDAEHEASGEAVPPLDEAPPSAAVAWLVADRSCRPRGEIAGFELAFTRGADDVFVRTRPRP